MNVIIKVFIVMMTLWNPMSSSKAELRNHLLQNYTKELPPNDTLTVINLSFGAFHIIDFDDKDGKFTISGYLEVSWIDPRIAMNWASSQAFQTENLPMYFKDSEVWTPQIRQINPFSRSDFEKMVEETVMFQRDGSALMLKMDVFTTECKTDFFLFPFDTQSCSIDMVVWGFFMEETVLKARKNEVNRKLYEENNVWSMKDARISVVSIDGLGYNETFKVSKAEIEFKIERHSSYYVFFLIIPFILLQILQPFVFWMPWDSGERSSFSVTVLLAMAVYLTIVSEHIPKSSQFQLSFLGIKMVYDLCVAAYVQICVIYGLAVYDKSRQSELKVCEVSTDSTDTSANPDKDLSHDQNTDWIALGKKKDEKFFGTSSLFTLFSIVFPFLIYIVSVTL